MRRVENKLENDRCIYFPYLVVVHCHRLLSFISIAIVVFPSTSRLGVARSLSSMAISLGLSRWSSFSLLWIFGTDWFRPSSCIRCRGRRWCRMESLFVIIVIGSGEAKGCKRLRLLRLLLMLSVVVMIGVSSFVSRTLA